MKTPYLKARSNKLALARVSVGSENEETLANFITFYNGKQEQTDYNYKISQNIITIENERPSISRVIE